MSRPFQHELDQLLPALEGFTRPRRFPVFEHPHLEASLERVRQVEQATDEFGLAYELYRYYPRTSRQYIARALEFLRVSKRVSLQEQGIGTGPEMVVFGGLLYRGFLPYGGGPRTFVFQSSQLGGRELPGGAVVDIVVNIGENVGVRVQGKFHRLDNPFGTGGAESEEDERQRIRLLSYGAVDRLVDVNRNLELERGPDPLVEREFDRILRGV